MEDVPSLEDYVKSLRKRDADADAEREAKRRKREAEREAFLKEQAEKEKADKAAALAVSAAASTAATPMQSFGDQAPFEKVPEPTDTVTEPSFDVMKEQSEGKAERVERFVLDASEKTSWTLGRQAGVVDFVVSHESCSRKHATVQLWNGQILIKDEATTHGTFVDGRQLPKNVPIRLVSGANVKFGASTRVYIFRMPKFHSKAMIEAARRGVQMQPTGAGFRYGAARKAPSDFD
eukprot:TRINITY_DN9676_c0_g1_i1.p1 TRINITY_DN9676_c0_g1~~TRINITY_DN9676_c0_g1_i1.p1  ORF type:complete len:235 (+),score=75.61 TRINITY_DN9676_c0_g1_i1:113-817(+)